MGSWPPTDVEQSNAAMGRLNDNDIQVPSRLDMVKSFDVDGAGAVRDGHPMTIAGDRWRGHHSQ